MKMKSWLKSVVIALCVVSLAGPAFAKKGDSLVDVKTAWVTGQECFPIWLAKKNGWDKEKGMNIVTNFYGSGHEALEDFAGEQMQCPPMYSAVKIKGKKLYEYARNGEEVSIKPRKIKIYDIKFLEYNRICQKLV